MQITLIAVTIILLAASQVAQKFAARQVRLDGGAVRTIFSMAKSAGFWVAVVLLGTAMATWLLALTTAEVSKAYPMLASSFILTAIASRLFLGEAIGRRRWLGIGLISLGAATMMATL
jgi:drug/metabolite transporter (DMT)-like permease